jgi:hypothetical protein
MTLSIITLGITILKRMTFIITIKNVTLSIATMSAKVHIVMGVIFLNVTKLSVVYAKRGIFIVMQILPCK